MKPKSTYGLDVLGISSATLCLLHCLIFPFLTLLPFAFMKHYLIDAAFACVGIFVVYKILVTDTNLTVKLILGYSILFVTLGVVLETVLDFHSWLIIIGGLGMIIGHLLNFKSHAKIAKKNQL